MTFHAHLAILTQGWIERILNGTKAIESRFSKVRSAPFGKVNEGDVVFMKESSGLVKGAFRVGKVETFENLTTGQICDLFYKEYREQIFSDLAASMYDPPEKWLTAKHATLIHIAETLEYYTPFAIHKRDRRAWVVYDHINDFTKTIVDENLRESVEDILSPNSEILAFLES